MIIAPPIPSIKESIETDVGFDCCYEVINNTLQPDRGFEHIDPVQTTPA